MEILKHVDPFEVITKTQIVQNTKNVILNGNSKINYQIIKEAIKNSEVASVTLISSKKIDILNPKFRQIQHDDFLNLKPIEEEFKSKDICFYSEDELKKDSIEKFKNFAQILNDNNDEELSFNFQSEKSTKLRNYLSKESEFNFEESEEFLRKLKFKNLNIFKPGFIYDLKDDKIIFENENVKKFYNILFFKQLRKFYFVNSKELGKAMLEFGLSNISKRRILENREIIDYIKLREEKE
eukprot:gene3504-6152_t